MFLFHLGNERGFHIRLFAFRGFRSVCYHDDAFAWMKWSCGFVKLVTTIVLAIKALVFWAIIKDMSKKVADMTRVVIIFRLRAIDRIKAFVFGIPEGPFKSALVIEQHLLLLRKEFEVFLGAWLAGNVGWSKSPVISFHKEISGILHKILWKEL